MDGLPLLEFLINKQRFFRHKRHVHLHGERTRTLADQQIVPRALHHQPRDADRIGDVADRGDRARLERRAIHHDRVQLDMTP